MFFNKLFQKFCQERNIGDSTIKGYDSALKSYVKFCGMSLDELYAEALNEEDEGILVKNRKIKKRLLSYRNYLLNSNLSPNTVKTYFSKVKTFYQHFEIELPHLPDAKYDSIYETSYLDLPTKMHISKALEIVDVDLKAVILFMSSSGTAKAETLSLSVEQFINGTVDYHNGGDIYEVLNELESRSDVVPTFYIHRLKTDKYYYTFCSPEASDAIVEYLKTRENLKPEDPLFDFNNSSLMIDFQEINDFMGWGFKGNYRFFRSHALRKFHASNIGLSAEYIDSLQGRSKNEVHSTYIKSNPKRLKKLYMSAMENVMIYKKGIDIIQEDVNVKKEEYNIAINIIIGGDGYNIL